MASPTKGNTMNIIIDIHLILEMKLTVKVFSRDITDEVNKRIAMTRPVNSTNGFKKVCHELAEEFCMRLEDKHDLSGRIFARTRIIM